MMRMNRIPRRISTACLASACATLAWSQALQQSGPDYVQTIPVPGWSVGTANVDALGFNPATGILYLADRTNRGVDVIDTHSNTVIGLIPMFPTAVPNVPVVAIDLQQLAVSDGVSSVFVWDLREPTPSQPTQYAIGAPGSQPDGMDYDPINRTLYVVTDVAPYTLTGINLVEKKITTQTPLPASADLLKFNPVDGKIYISAEDADNKNAGAGVMVYDPVAGAVTAWYKVGPACPGHGIDIDPVSNIAVVGCFGAAAKGDMAMDLSNGTVLKYFADVGGTDTVTFDPANRRFYAAAGLNSATTSGCPATPNTPPFGSFVPILGVISAKGWDWSPVKLDGVACTGRGNHTAGVDPITNTIYVPASQYPADPSSATTGQAGILVFKDNSRFGQPFTQETDSQLTPINGSSTTADLKTYVYRTRVFVHAHASNVSGTTAWLVIPTTVGNESAACTVDATKNTATCDDYLLGEPLLGAAATLSVSSGAVARGEIDFKDDDRHGHH